MSINLGNVVGLLRSETPPIKKYILWGKILNPSIPDIVEVNYWDEISEAWIPITDPTHQYWLRPVITKTLNTPPLNPQDGDRYMVATGGAGSWSGKDDQIATRKNGTWVFQLPLDGYYVSVRDIPNTLFDYRGVYGAGGVWVESDFQVDVAPGDFIPITQKDAPGGVAALDFAREISNEYLKEDLITFNPANLSAWPANTNTIKKALDHLVSLAGVSVVGNVTISTAPDTITLSLGGFQIIFINLTGNIATAKEFTLAGDSAAVEIWFAVNITNSTNGTLKFPAGFKSDNGNFEPSTRIWGADQPGVWVGHAHKIGSTWYLTMEESIYE